MNLICSLFDELTNWLTNSSFCPLILVDQLNKLSSNVVKLIFCISRHILYFLYLGRRVKVEVGLFNV